MHKVSFIGMSVLLLGIGCKQPTEVEVRSDVVADELEVAALSVTDTSTYQDQLDSVAVTPEDQSRFNGFMLVTRTTFDVGYASVTRTKSSVVLTDPSQPLSADGKTYGYRGIDMRSTGSVPISLNGLAMSRVDHQIRVEGESQQWGYEFTRDLSAYSARFDTTYTWSGSCDTVGAFNVSIQAPPIVTVASPAGGSHIARSEDLTLNWNAGGAITIYLSRVDSSRRTSHPLLVCKPLGTSGCAVLSAKILQALSRGTYVFTFVSSVRKEGEQVGTYGYNVLVQAASVYNSYVELQ